MEQLVKNRNICVKLKELYLQLCRFLDDTFHGKTWLSKLNWYLILAVASAIYLPIASGKNYFTDIGILVIAETYFAVFLIFFISCTALFNKSKILLWVSVILLLLRYITLIDSGAEWNKQFNTIYLGVTLTYFATVLSFNSAKKINCKGGVKDTIILAIGLACLVIGVFLSNNENTYYRELILIGFSLIYLYAIARALFWILFTKEKNNFNLIKVLWYIVAFVVLIVLLPFILEYAGVSEEVLKEIIIPIYSAVIGDFLTLAGVAWTIRKGDADRKETNHNSAAPFLGIIEETSEDITDALINNKKFVRDGVPDYCLKFVCPIINSSKCEFSIEKIQIGDMDYFPEAMLLIKKEEKVAINVMDEETYILNKQTIKLFVEDMNYEHHIFKIVYDEKGKYNQIVKMPNE